jgi:hypothetical protein
MFNRGLSEVPKGTWAPKAWLAAFIFSSVVSVLGTLGTLLLANQLSTKVSTSAACLAMLLSLIMAMRLVKAGISGPTLIRATSTGRIVMLTWFLVFILFFGSICLSFITSDEGVGATIGRAAGRIVNIFEESLSALLGYALFFAVVGPGYTEYREALGK